MNLVEVDEAIGWNTSSSKSPRTEARLRHHSLLVEISLGILPSHYLAILNATIVGHFSDHIFVILF